MTVTVAQFRANFPEFSSTADYPTSQIQFWLDFAAGMINESRWGRQTDMGIQLYAAYNLVIEIQNQKAAASGGAPGLQSGPINSKSVDKVSVGVDTGIASEDGAGSWNLNTYGQRLYRLIRLFGAGPIQLGIGSTPPGMGPAWPGPYTGPSPTGFGN